MAFNVVDVGGINSELLVEKSQWLNFDKAVENLWVL
jgi:hypothetical protein